jgi:hypothetical protein
MIKRDPTEPEHKVGHFNVQHAGRWHYIPYRDSKKQRLYSAEAVLKIGSERMTFEECQKFIHSVTESAMWKALCKRNHTEKPSVSVLKGHGCNAQSFQRRIRLAPWGYTKVVCLHELAHICTPRTGHHWPFAEAFLTLVGAHLGAAARNILALSFKRHKVRFTPPKLISEERRAELRARGLALAAMRRATPPPPAGVQ